MCSLTLNCTYDRETKDRLNIWVDDFSVITPEGDLLTLPPEYQTLVDSEPSLTRDWVAHLAINDKFLRQSLDHGLLFAVDKIQFGVREF